MEDVVASGSTPQETDANDEGRRRAQLMEDFQRLADVGCKSEEKLAFLQQQMGSLHQQVSSSDAPLRNAKLPFKGDWKVMSSRERLGAAPPEPISAAPPPPAKIDSFATLVALKKSASKVRAHSEVAAEKHVVTISRAHSIPGKSKAKRWGQAKTVQLVTAISDAPIPPEVLEGKSSFGLW